MNHAFTVNFNFNTVFKSDKAEITQLFINDQSIGYIAENINTDSNTSEPVVTPFTEAGEMKESHCVGCAAEQLFAAVTGFPVESIGITSNGAGRSPLAALLMAGVLSAAIKGR